VAAVQLVPEDLEPFAEIPRPKALAMIEDVLAMAATVAPCLFEATLIEAKERAARAILRGAILRWHDAGNGAVQTTQTSVDDYSRSQTVDTRGSRRGLFWPSEITDLQKLCADAGSGGAFTIDFAPGSAIQHAPICALYFLANYCSCGADLTLAGPLWEEPA
jgi:hypothetical protein